MTLSYTSMGILRGGEMSGKEFFGAQEGGSGDKLSGVGNVKEEVNRRTYGVSQNKKLSYRRETALQPV